MVARRLLITVLLFFCCASVTQAQPWVGMTPGTWYQYPSSNANTVKQAANTYPDWNGSSSAFYDQCESGPTSNVGFFGIMSAWSGGAYDPVNRKLYIWGGGHGDYCGNEVLSFNLVTGAWVRETNRWLYVDQGTAPNSYTDSVFEQPYGVYSIDAALTAPATQQPRSTHTYNALQWVPTRNGFCSFGLPSTSHGSAITPASHLVFCWNQTSKQWFPQGSIDTTPGIFSTMRGAYSTPDPRDPSIFWVHSSTYGATLYKCQLSAGTTGVSCVKKAPATDIQTERTAVMLPDGTMYVIGGAITGPGTYGHRATQRGTFDLTNNIHPSDVVNITTTGDTDLESIAAPGACYLPTANRIVAWSGGADIYVLNPDTNIWTKRTPAAGNTVTPTGNTFNGTYGRMRCDESLGILFGVNAVNQDVYLYKLPTDLANPPSHTLTLTNNGPITVPLATAQNTGVSATITATATGGNLLVTFSAPPSGSPTFTPTTCTPGGGGNACAVTFSYPPNPSAVPGSFPVTITGTDSFPSTAQTTVTFVVQPTSTSFGNIAALQHAGPATPEQISMWLPFTGSVPTTVTATVRYRQAGTTTWITGHPMSRVRPEIAQPGTAGAVTPGFSWPILGLTPGTAYETEVTLTDSNGGASEVRTATFTTRALPGTTGPANKFATVGMSGPALRSLIDTLQPGDVLELPVGTYDLQGAIQVDASGTESQPIVIRGASKTGTILQQTNGGFVFYIVYGNHIRIENMTVQGRGVDSGTQSDSSLVYMWSNTRPQNIVVRDINASGFDKCLIGTAMDRVMFYNNTCFGNNQWNATFLQDNRTWNDDATNMPGTGNVAFQNTFDGFGDCASFAFGGHADVQNIGIYFYRNDYNRCGDDGVEVDHLYGPGAFYDNRLYNVMTCLSIDPLYGGPFIYARNICINAGRQVFKLTDGNSNYFVYNNTIATTNKNQGVQAGVLSFSAGNNPANFVEGNPQASWGLRNNIILYCEGDGRPLYWESPFWVDTDGLAHVDWSYNSWGVGADTRFTVQPNTYADLAAAIANIPTTGGVFTNATKRFTNDTITACQPFVGTLALGNSYLNYQGTKYDLTVKNGEAPKNSGIAIANITDGFSGVAPDRGAVIDGRAAVIYGVQGGGGTPPGIPGTPTNLRNAQAATPTLVQLAWDFTSVPANLEQGFRIYRRLYPGGSYGAPTFTIPAGTLTLNDNTVAANTAYAYKVSAYNGTGESAMSAEHQVTTPNTGGGALTGVIPILSYRAWYGTNTIGSGAAIEQAVIAKPEFQALAPSYCVTGRASMNCVQTQTTMDREIQIAAAAGIKAFAFSWFGNATANLGPGGDSSLQASYGLYQSSALTDTKFALIMQPGYLGATDFAGGVTNWHANVNTIATIMGQARYQKVLTSRPIIFLYYYAPDITTYFNNSLANLGTAITYLRSLLPSNNPYVVLMMPGASVATMNSTKTTIGADALSDYYVQLAPATTGASKTYATQDAAVQARWTALNGSGDAIVPPLQVIGGRRPQLTTPSVYTPGFYPRMGEALFWTRGTPAQLAAGQFTAAMQYLQANPSVVPSKAVWIWSAYDGSEGGYPLMPTIGDPPQTQPPYTAGASTGLTGLLNILGPLLYSYR